MSTNVNNDLYRSTLSPTQRVLTRDDLDLVLDSLDKVSDYFFATREKVKANVQNRNVTVIDRCLDESEIRQIVYVLGDDAAGLYDSIMSDPNPRDRSYTTRTTHTRYRVVIVRTADKRQARVRIVMRRLENQPWPLSKLRVPPGLLEATQATKPGLIMITGATGSGKTSLLSGLIRVIVEDDHGNNHVVTIEDPVEYLYGDVASDNAVVSPIEIGEGCSSFSDGLRAALRMHPTHILVGEIRDAETASTCIAAARSGHKVFATMHTSSVPEIFSRWADFFPESAKRRAITDLATVIDYAIYQTLEHNETGFAPVQESLDFTQFIRSKFVGEMEKCVDDIYGTIHTLVDQAGVTHKADWDALNPTRALQSKEGMS